MKAGQIRLPAADRMKSKPVNKKTSIMLVFLSDLAPLNIQWRIKVGWFGKVAFNIG